MAQSAAYKLDGTIYNGSLHSQVCKEMGIDNVEGFYNIMVTSVNGKRLNFGEDGEDIAEKLWEYGQLIDDAEVEEESTGAIFFENFKMEVSKWAGRGKPDGGVKKFTKSFSNWLFGISEK